MKGKFKYKLVIDDDLDNTCTVVYSYDLDTIVNMFKTLEFIYKDKMFIVSCQIGGK